LSFNIITVEESNFISGAICVVYVCLCVYVYAVLLCTLSGLFVLK